MNGEAWVSRAVLGTQRGGTTATTELMRQLQDYVLLDGVCQSLMKSRVSIAAGPVVDPSPLEGVGAYLRYAAEKVPSVALQFCEALSKRGMACPLSALPEVLALGIKFPDAIRPVLGPRGHWLASFDPKAALLFAPILPAGNQQGDIAVGTGSWTFERLSEALAQAPTDVRGPVFARLLAFDPQRAIELAIDRWTGEVTQVRVAILRAVRDVDSTLSSALLDLGLEARAPEVQEEARKVAALRSEKFQDALRDSLSRWLMDPTSKSNLPLDWSFRLLPPSVTVDLLGGWDAVTPDRFSPTRQNDLLRGVCEAAQLHRDGAAVQSLCNHADRLGATLEIPSTALRLLDPDARERRIQQWLALPQKSRPQRLLSEAVLAHGPLNPELSQAIGNEILRAANQPKGSRSQSTLNGEEFALALALDVAEEVLDRLNSLPLSPREHLRRVWIPILHLRLKLLRPLESIS